MKCSEKSAQQSRAARESVKWGGKLELALWTSLPPNHLVNTIFGNCFWLHHLKNNLDFALLAHFLKEKLKDK